MTVELNKIYCTECTEGMKRYILNESIDLTITSPPYDNIRLYKGYEFNFKNIAKELYRVTKLGGVIVWVVGDQTINGSETGTSFEQALYFKKIGFNLHDTMIYEKNGSSYPASINSKRYTSIFEYMFIFSKGIPKTTNLIMDKKNKWGGTFNWGKNTARQKTGDLKIQEKKQIKDYGIRNNIWKYNTGYGYSTKDKIAFEHPASFPEKLVEDHILSWSNENDIVFDPMCGSGTTCKMAKLNNRNYIGMDISKEYCELSEKRLSLTSKKFM